MLEVLKKLDSFGQVYHPTYDKKTKFTNSLGGVFTIITFVVAAGCVWGFGNEIIYKRNPRVNANTVVSKRRRNFTLKMPTSFTVEFTGDKFGSVENWERYIQIKAFYVNSTLTPSNDLMLKSYEVPFRKCKFELDFHESLAYDFKFNKLDNAYCFANEIEIGGYWNNEYVKNIRVEVSPCQNGTLRNNCVSKDETLKFLQPNNKQIGIYYQNIIFDSNNYEVPYQYYFDALYIKLESLQCKLMQMEIKEVNLTTDFFPMWEMSTSHSEQTVDRVTTDAYSPDYNDDCIFKIYIFSSDRADKIKRTYLKLQEVLAQLGGILSIFMIVFEIVIRVTYQRRMNEEVIRVLFEIDDEEIIKDVENKLTLKKAVNVTKTLKPKSITRKDTDKSPVDVLESVRNINTDENHSSDVPEEDKGEKGGVISTIERVESQMNNNAEKSTPDGNDFNNVFFDRHIHYFFTLCDNLTLVFCFPCSGMKLKRLNEIYEKLHEHSIFYTDVLHIAKKISEIEKLKYILFSKKQLAYFNHVCRLENPLMRGRPSKLTEFYKYSLNYKQQKKDIEDYLKKMATQEKKSRIDKKLTGIWD